MMKKLDKLNFKHIFGREEMKKIIAGSGSGGIACMYYVSGGWTGRLTGCQTYTWGAGGSSVSYETCYYEAYDPHNMGYTGRREVNGAVARQC